MESGKGVPCGYPHGSLPFRSQTKGGLTPELCSTRLGHESVRTGRTPHPFPPHSCCLDSPGSSDGTLPLTVFGRTLNVRVLPRRTPRRSVSLMGWPISSTSEDCGHFGNAVPDSNGGPPVQVSRQLPS